MDWEKAIETNRAALIRLVAELVAMLELAGGLAGERLTRTAFFALHRLLRPTEAALRRLIVIMARGLEVAAVKTRPMPKGLVIAGKGTGPMAFQLFDTRKSFAFTAGDSATAAGAPRIHVFSSDPLVPSADVLHTPPPLTDFDATDLRRRIAALSHALGTLPRQAQRLARWKARRAKMENPKFISPLRPGPPPGHNSRSKDAINGIVRNCHDLAFEALREDSS
jgi:hypothetical protein